jgi:hypothetical protein
MTRRHRFLTLALALSLAPALLGAPPAISLAQLTAGAASTKAIATDTLTPPGSLTATGGLTAVLLWTPTADLYAAGYQVHRATVSGGPYSQVATVTPRAATSMTDTPSTNGTYYYVLRSYFQNWVSVDSNQVSAVVGPPVTGTGFKGCTITSNVADPGGNGNGYELLASNACGDDLLSATDVNSGTNITISCTDAGKDRHRFWDFGLGVPATVTSIDGIQVRADVGMNNNGGTNQICVQLSWDGGTTWTAAKSQSLTGGSTITTYTLGAANDTWGRTWLGSQLSNANFRVRVIDVTSQPNKNFLLEYLAVQVTYTP